MGRVTTIQKNSGSLSDEEIEQLKKVFPNDNRIVLSLFQEVYNEECYHKFFGNYDTDNPKSDYARRRSTARRFLNAGFSQIDIGILIGLHDINQEVASLKQHISELLNMADTIYVSLPRVLGCKQIHDTVSDDKYELIIKELSEDFPSIKLIITTRENNTFIKKVLPYISVISPGCSDVLPYTVSGKIENNLQTSQFQVKLLRDRPTEVLEAINITQSIKYYDRGLMKQRLE